MKQEQAKKEDTSRAAAMNTIKHRRNTKGVIVKMKDAGTITIHTGSIPSTSPASSSFLR